VKEKLKNLSFMLLFALVFGSVGVFAACVIFGTIAFGVDARDWVLVRADVVSASNGEVTYRYKVNDIDYVGSRTGTFVLGAGDNISADLYDRAVEARSTGKAITVYVNPDNPSLSVIDRSIDWKALTLFLPFMLGFGGVAAGALYIGLRGFVPARPGKKKESSGLGALWFMTFMWNAMAFPITFAFVPEALAEGEYLKLLLLVFPLIGLLLLWGALYGTWKAISGRFKRSTLGLNKEASQVTAAKARESGSP